MSFQRATFSVVIPFYNEELFLEKTLSSWTKQERLPDQMILVDNASTDQSPQIARKFANEWGHTMEITILHETNPGKVHALERAQKHLNTEWVVFCDADTWYPPHYLKIAEQLVEKSAESVVALMAVDVSAPPDRDWDSRKKIWLKWIAAQLFPGKCHTGGFGQIFRVSALRKAGGFSAARWSFVLMDHEIVERIHRFGVSLYDRDLWCIPSARRSDRSSVRWTVWERVIYFLHPRWAGHWFFQRFLRHRFTKRRLGHLNLRQQPWNLSSLTSKVGVSRI